MFDFLESLKGLLKIDRVCVDDNVFRLHYKATLIALSFFSMVITAKQYVGDPIDCMVQGVPAKMMDSYCWIYSTYTLPRAADGRVGKDVAHPGVTAPRDGDQVRHHKYYQWVCVVLFLQAVTFYVPRYLWKTWEGGRIRALSQDLSVVVTAERKSERIRVLTDYFAKNVNAHNLYAYQYAACELFNFAIVIAHIVFLDWFLEREFRTYGVDVLRYSDTVPENRTDPMARVFPKVTKCQFQFYGPSGNIQKLDGLCVLPLNIVNEKIFVFLWCWFLTLAVVDAVNLVYRAVVNAVPAFRSLLLKWSSRLTSHQTVRTVVDKCPVGSWFLLYQLSKNVDSVVFNDLLIELDEALSDQESYMMH